MALAKVLGTSPIATPEPIPDEGVDGEIPVPTPTPTPDAPEPSGDPATDLAIAIAQAQAAYEAGQQALTTGDFTAYDVAQKQLAAALQRAAEAQAALSGATVPEPAPEIPADTGAAA